MQRDREYLLDILEAAKIIHDYVVEKTQDDFLKDIQCQDAVVRRLEIIGEASRRISEQTQETLSDVPWTEMAAMRNRLIHRYDDIDMVIVWDTIGKDVPQLITLLETFLNDT